jgi:hypothetical protein
MDEHPEYPTAAGSDAGCAACGSTRVTFRVARAHGVSTPLSQRSLVRECRDCLTRWAERLVVFRTPDPA